MWPLPQAWKMEIKDHLHDISCSKYYFWNPPGEVAILLKVHWKISFSFAKEEANLAETAERQTDRQTHSAQFCTLLLCALCYGNKSHVMEIYALLIYHCSLFISKDCTSVWEGGLWLYCFPNNKYNKCSLFLNNQKIQIDINKKVKIPYYSKHPEIIVINIQCSDFITF